MKVAVIGGGAAGLCAARKCVEACLKVTLFEATHSIGGTWVFTPQTNVHSSMYENMRTNLPKEIMRFSDLKFADCLPSFLSHTDVLDYLHEYSRPIKQFIKLGYAVEEVKREGMQWKVSYSHDDVKRCENFDVVFVCNGHYVIPYIPHIDGSFSGLLLHSHDYRNPKRYVDKRVAVVGAGPSGIDITLQLADVAREVYLLSDKEPLNCALPSNVVQRCTATHYNNNELYLQDGSTIEVDSIIFCTGYLYSCDFLGDLVQLRFGQKMLSPTFLHVAHTQYPTSLFFIGLNTTVLPFTLFECQIKLALALIDGSAKVADQEIKSWENERLLDLESRGINGSMFHYLGNAQWDYFEQLLTIACCSYRVPPIMRLIYEDTSKRRRENVMFYKMSNYHIENDSFTVH